MLTIDNLLAQSKTKTNQVINDFRARIAKFRTGRPDAGILKDIQVPCYNQQLPLWELASINVFDATSITVQPFDPHNLPVISKAILQANLNLNPIAVGDKLLRINVPPLTSESRSLIVKNVWSTTETYQVRLRNYRRQLVTQVKKLKLSRDVTHESLTKIDGQFKQLTQKVHDLARQKVHQLSAS